MVQNVLWGLEYGDGVWRRYHFRVEKGVRYDGSNMTSKKNKLLYLYFQIPTWFVQLHLF